MKEVKIEDLETTLRGRAKKLERLLEENREANQGINEALKQLRTLNHLIIIITEHRTLAEDDEERTKTLEAAETIKAALISFLTQRITTSEINQRLNEKTIVD